MIRCSGVSGLADLDLVKKIIVVTEINAGGNRLTTFIKEMRPGDNSVACGKEEESPRGDHKWDCKGWQPVLNSLVC